MASETRIKALGDELITVRGELSKAEADLNAAKVRSYTTVEDFKNSPVFENYIESMSQQWVSDFHRNEGFIVEMQQATLTGANRVLDKIKALHPEWNVVEEVKHPIPRPLESPE